MKTEKHTSTAKNPAAKLEVAAFKQEVLRLQKENAKLKAQLHTATTALKIQAPIIKAAQKESDEHKQWSKLAREALMSAV